MPGLHRLLIQSLFDNEERIRDQAFTDGFVSGAGTTMILVLVMLACYELWWRR